MPQLVHARALAGDHALCKFDRSAQDGLLADSILSRIRLNPNDADARIVGSTVMSTIAKVTNPCLEGWGIVLLDEVAIGADGGVTRNRSPVTARGNERYVASGVCVEVVCLARFGVGVEEEI